MPEVPTFQELGFDFVRTQWFGVVAPAGTPEDVLATLSAEIERILNDSSSDELLKRFHFSSAYQSPDEFRAQLERESTELLPVLTKIGMAKK